MGETGSLEPLRIGILGFDGVSGLDLTSPLEALSRARCVRPGVDDTRCYQPSIIALQRKSFRTESGLSLQAGSSAEAAGAFDTIIIPGGPGIREPETLHRIAVWLASQAHATRRIASISTGVYALAAAGLVDGRIITTHWRFARDVALRFPKVKVTQSAAFVRNERFYTSGGGTAGIQMTLAMVEDDCGLAVARSVAREMLVRLRPAAEGDENFDAANGQVDPAERVSDLPAWISEHLHERLSIETLAERACVCPRHFRRLFKHVFGCTPSDFVEELRLAEARRRLLGMRSSVESIAASVGFQSSNAFRRAFERRVGTTPSAFRRAGNSPSPVENGDARRHGPSTRPQRLAA